VKRPIHTALCLNIVQYSSSEIIIIIIIIKWKCKFCLLFSIDTRVGTLSGNYLFTTDTK